MTEDNTHLTIITQKAADFKLNHWFKEEASKHFEKLVKGHYSIEALVGLIQTTAVTDVEKAETYKKGLKPLLGLKGIDVNALEKTCGARNIEKSVDYYEMKSKEKVKKKRKPRYLKGFDLENPGSAPDPERWLPKRERSSYRPKRKDKRAAQTRGSQGVVGKEGSSCGNSKSSQTSRSKGLSGADADQHKHA